MIPWWCVFQMILETLGIKLHTEYTYRWQTVVLPGGNFNGSRILVAACVDRTAMRTMFTKIQKLAKPRIALAVELMQRYRSGKTVADTRWCAYIRCQILVVAATATIWLPLGNYRAGSNRRSAAVDAAEEKRIEMLNGEDVKWR